jgi:predicted nucleic acid-binding protein
LRSSTSILRRGIKSSALAAEKAGTPVRRTDAMIAAIAAIAIDNEADFFTFDSKHFGQLKSLGLNMFS